jgi:phage host-nuclease inhibitor protein Gam
VIKPKNEMPISREKQKDPCTELCSVHPTEIIKFYCEDHNSVGCGDCIVLSHKTCSVKLVNNVSDNYDACEEFGQTKKKSESLLRRISSYQGIIVDTIKAADEMRERIMKDIHIFRQEINEYLDNAEADLLKRIDQLTSKQVSQLGHIQKEFESMATEMKECQDKINKNTNTINQLFVIAKLAHEKIDACQISTEELASKCEIETFDLVKSQELGKLVTDKLSIGVINEEKRMLHTLNKISLTDVQTTLLEKLNVLSAVRDRTASLISGMAIISCDELLLVDCSNDCFKLITVEKFMITFTLNTNGKPWDITAINSGLFAVTVFTTGEILFINTSNGISKSHSIKVRKDCRGIDYRNGVLVVSFGNPACVQLLDIKGNIMKELDIDKHCSYPHYIAFCYDDNKSFIVSSSCNNALFEFGPDWKLKDKIKSNDIKYPEQLVVTHDGAVIVCCGDISDRLIMITPHTREVLSITVEGIKRPMCMAISDDQTRMFISDASDRNIKVFGIK